MVRLGLRLRETGHDYGGKAWSMKGSDGESLWVMNAKPVQGLNCGESWTFVYLGF